MRGKKELAALLVHQHRDDVGFWREVDEAADGFAVPSPARQLRAIEREEAAVGREHHQSVGRLGVNPETPAIAFAVFDRVVFLLMALHRAEPELLRADDG